MLRQVPLIVVLDGLEVLQEPPGELGIGRAERLTYGEFLADDLRTFLTAACQLGHRGLILLTSRFPFTDLSDHLGRSLRLLQLDHLMPAQGAELLASLDVGGETAEREDVTRRLEGHPLALRVFAAALARQGHRDPTRLLGLVFDQPELGDDDPLERKVRQLLTFYEAALPSGWRALLGILGLFPDELPLGTVQRVARELPAAQAHLDGYSDEQIRAALDTLCADGLVTLEHRFDEPGYACHPVIRDHFRTALIGGDPSAAGQAADLLTGALTGTAKSATQVRTVTSAIQILLDARDVKRADDLYRERLDNGKVFRNRALPREGAQCALRFVADQDRRARVRADLGLHRLSFYLNAVGLSARGAAESVWAERHYREAAELDEQAGYDRSRSAELRNLAELYVILGRLIEAEQVACQALELAQQDREDLGRCNSLSAVARTLDPQGRVTEAITSFEEADTIKRRIDPWALGLGSMWGVWFADLLLRLGRTTKARRRTEHNLHLCEIYGWREDTARCHWLLGRLDTLDGKFAAAAAHLEGAEATMRGGHQLADLPPILLAQADLQRRQQNWDEAQRIIEEAVNLAGSRSMRLRDYLD